MKTSKIILIAFVFCIFAGMITLFIATKAHEKNIDKDNIKEVIALPPFSVIVGENGSRFRIESGKINKLTISYPGKKTNVPSPFVIKKDTLYIVEKLNTKEPGRVLQIQCSNVHTIIARHTNDININHFNTNTLKIIADKGILFLGLEKDGTASNKANKISNLTYLAKNRSFLTMQATQIDKMKVSLDQSTILLQYKNNIKSVSAEIKDSSNINVYSGSYNSIQKMDFIADLTSKYALDKQD